MKQWEGWSKKLATNEKEALTNYSSDPEHKKPTDYVQINKHIKHLRGTDSNPTKDTRSAIKGMDSAIQKGSVPQDTTVYRGMPPVSSNMVGKIITDDAYVSTSLNQRTAASFSRNTIAEIRIPQGAKAAYIDNVVSNKNLKLFDRPREHEMLLPRGSKFRVLSTKQEGKKTRIIMELVQ